MCSTAASGHESTDQRGHDVIEILGGEIFLRDGADVGIMDAGEQTRGRRHRRGSPPFFSARRGGGLREEGLGDVAMDEDGLEGVADAGALGLGVDDDIAAMSRSASLST
jgi:hypothetical protein